METHWQHMAKTKNERRTIMGALNYHGDLSMDELSKVTGMSRTRVRVRVHQLVGCGELSWSTDHPSIVSTPRA
jgi:predicted ArsR family transcriptional regulator